MSYPLSEPLGTRRHYHAEYRKDPDSVMPYTVNWDAIIPAADTIDTATSTAYAHRSTSATTDITVDSTTTASRTTTTVLSGGVVHADYDITVHVVTNGGYEDDRTIRIRCRHL